MQKRPNLSHLKNSEKYTNNGKNFDRTDDGKRMSPNEKLY